MIDVGGDDGAAARNLVAHELGGDVPGGFGRERVGARVGAQQLAITRVVHQGVDAGALAQRHELHLRRDDPALGVGHLRRGGAAFGAQGFLDAAEAHVRRRGVGRALAPVGAAFVRQALDVAARLDPRQANGGKPSAQVDVHPGVGIGPGNVVQGNGGIGLDARFRHGVVLADLAKWNANRGIGPRDPNFAGARVGKAGAQLVVDALQGRFGIGVEGGFGHVSLRPRALRGKKAPTRPRRGEEWGEKREMRGQKEHETSKAGLELRLAPLSTLRPPPGGRPRNSLRRR